MAETNNVFLRSDFGALKNLVAFDLRNGDVSSAVSMITKAAIPNYAKWMVIAGLPSAHAIRYTDVFIKAAAHVLSLNPPTEMGNERLRKISIVLGTMRATMTELYRLEPADLIPGEVADTVITYVPPVAPATEPTWTVAPTVSAAQRASLLGDLALTDDEKAVISQLVLCAVGLPPVQGASLMATGHHYLSDVKDKSRQFYAVIENQFFKKEPAKTWFSADQEALQDAMWHKAGHPIAIPLKLKWAVDGTIAEKIRKAGAGSAASRLPAKETTLRAAETARTLLVNVRPFYENYGGALNIDLLAMAIEVVNSYLPGVTVGAPGGVTIPGVDPNNFKPAACPPYVVDRESALKWLDDIRLRNIDTIAIAFGFFEAICDSATSTATSKDEQTLRGAYSLTSLKNNCFSSYELGREYHGDYRAYKSTQRQAGAYTPPKPVIL